MHALQQSVRAFVRRHDLETAIAPRLLDAVSELGELAKEALRGSAYGRAKFVRTENWSAELGDVGFSLLCLANSTGVDFEAAVRAALGKYERRIAQRGSAASAAAPRRTAKRRGNHARK
jgi:NTP pyrophosphatase (non-canonical NTP hydrolase)